VSGLFATLVGAAQGTAPAAEPQPRARFDEGFGSQPGIEWREADPLPQPELRLPTASPGPSQAVERRPSAVSLAPAAERPAEPLLTKPEPMLPARAVAPPPVSSVAARTGDPAPSILRSEHRARPARGEIEPQARPRGETDASAPPAAASPEAAVSPLLPTIPEAAVRRPASDAPIHARRGEVDEALAGPLLKIGRIEVRPPAPPAMDSVAPAKPATVTTRAVIVPRAQVRQSLDDYRASRRR
jgi:hypothetical protein